MLYKKDFLEKCEEYNFSYIYLSIHGGTEEVHNKMT
jgi:MoaA/NifB/PqqE/SkfB family radical SAM enzyme